MKIIYFFRPLRFMAIFGAVVCCAGSALAEASQAGSKPADNGLAKTNKPVAATNTPIVIPKSEFIIPTSIADGRDPFFPDRTIGNNDTPKTPKTAATGLIILRGISGRFALINGRTLEVGEEADISVGSSRVHIRCLTIKEDSVIIEAEGKPVELKLRSGI